MPEQVQQQRSFIEGSVSEAGQLSFRYNGPWSDLFTLIRLIEIGVEEEYKEGQRKAMIPQPVPTTEFAQPVLSEALEKQRALAAKASFVARRDKKKRK